MESNNMNKDFDMFLDNLPLFPDLTQGMSLGDSSLFPVFDGILDATLNATPEAISPFSPVSSTFMSPVVDSPLSLFGSPETVNNSPPLGQLPDAGATDFLAMVQQQLVLQGVNISNDQLVAFLKSGAFDVNSAISPSLISNTFTPNTFAPVTSPMSASSLTIPTTDEDSFAILSSLNVPGLQKVVETYVKRQQEQKQKELEFLQGKPVKSKVGRKPKPKPTDPLEILKETIDKRAKNTAAARKSRQKRMEKLDELEARIATLMAQQEVSAAEMERVLKRNQELEREITILKMAVSSVSAQSPSPTGDSWSDTLEFVWKMLEGPGSSVSRNEFPATSTTLSNRPSTPSPPVVSTSSRTTTPALPPTQIPTFPPPFPSSFPSPILPNPPPLESSSVPAAVSTHDPESNGSHEGSSENGPPLHPPLWKSAVQKGQIQAGDIIPLSSSELRALQMQRLKELRKEFAQPANKSPLKQEISKSGLDINPLKQALSSSFLRTIEALRKGGIDDANSSASVSSSSSNSSSSSTSSGTIGGLQPGTFYAIVAAGVIVVLVAAVGAIMFMIRTKQRRTSARDTHMKVIRETTTTVEDGEKEEQQFTVRDSMDSKVSVDLRPSTDSVGDLEGGSKGSARKKNAGRIVLE
ncbi:hypothetical protein HK098_006645 [Nowakowskiella sp. JEL0407]|nr:hypothetical protein HK098_006645 [Nowakowskiella sp. JEL0407]